MRTRYSMLTVDTEALPNRAETDHVNRLILGIHGDHQAGVKEMATIASEFGARLVFFLDLCGSYTYLDELKAVATWLDGHNQDVQLHAHPEYLPKTFWKEQRCNIRPLHMNQYPDKKAEFIIGFFTRLLTEFLGKKPVAFRAGSFRWNSATIRALKKFDYKLSFNNSMSAMISNQCPFSLPTNKPFEWSNGIIEIPASEMRILPMIYKRWWARLQYPQSHYYHFRRRRYSMLPWSVSSKSDFMVFLLHSWSFLDRDKDGFEFYNDDKYQEKYRNFLKILSRETEIITTSELLELIEKGEIKLTHTEDLANAEYIPPKKAARK